jgi:hypothetical protein
MGERERAACSPRLTLDTSGISLPPAASAHFRRHPWRLFLAIRSAFAPEFESPIPNIAGRIHASMRSLRLGYASRRHPWRLKHSAHTPRKGAPLRRRAGRA